MTQRSGAHVRVSSDGGESECQSVCFLLHGSKEQVLLARCVLQNLAIDCEPAVEVLEVPQTAFGRIIGNWGRHPGVFRYMLYIYRYRVLIQIQA